MELDLVRGTLDLLILKTLSWGPMHGLGVLRWIERTTKDQLQIEEGALYPSLHRMEEKGWWRRCARRTANGRLFLDCHLDVVSETSIETAGARRQT
jgi:DNA-binding PadR family transcriptional regulator